MQAIRIGFILLALSGLGACSDNDDDGGGGSNPPPSSTGSPPAGGDGTGASGDGGSGGATGQGGGDTGGTGTGDGTGDGTGGTGGTGGGGVVPGGGGTGGTDGGGSTDGGTGGTDGGTGGGGGGGTDGTARAWSPASVIAYNQGHMTVSWVRVDDGGSVMTAYFDGDGTGGLYVSEFVPGSNNWGPSRRLGTPVTSSYADFERSPGGRAIAAWVENVFDRHELYVARYVPGVGWGDAHRFLAEDPYSPEVSIRDDGVAEVIYNRVNAAGQREVVIRTAMSDAAGFGEAQLVPSGGDVDLLDFATGTSERTLLLRTVPNPNLEVQAMRFVGGSWQGPVSLSDSGANTARVVMDNAGTARAYWTDGTQIHHRTVAAGSGTWGATEHITIFDEPGERRGNSAVAMNIQGEAVALGLSDTGLYTAHFRPAQGWSPPQRVFTGDAYNNNPNIAVSATGMAGAVWTSAPWDGDSPDYSNYNLWGSVYR